MGAMERLVDEGKARSIGVSNFDTWDLRESSAALHSQRIVCDQVLYNLSERTIEDHELPWAREHGCAIVAYSPFGAHALDEKNQKNRVLVEIAKAHRVSAHAVALAFLVRDPIVFAIPKASSVEHVDANAKAGTLKLSDDEIAAIDAAFPNRVRVGPLPTN